MFSLRIYDNKIHIDEYNMDSNLIIWFDTDAKLNSA